MKEPGRLFLEEKPGKTLILLAKAKEPLYPLVIAREIESTYAHTLNTLAKMERLRLVTFQEVGRLKLVRLTELGAETAKTIQSLLDLLSLADLERKIEQFHERAIGGRKLQGGGLEQAKRRLEHYKRELARWGEQREHVMSQVERLKRRVEEIEHEVRELA